MDSPEHDFVVLGDLDVAGTDLTGVLPQSPEQIEIIRAWLHPTDYSAESSEYRRHLNSYVPGTGKWIQEAQYQHWLEPGSHGALWVKGIPGAGKSVIAAQLVSNLKKDPKITVLYFFFRQIIASNRTPSSLICDWLSQILVHSPSLQSHLKDYLDKRRSLDSVAVDELWSLLIKALCNLPRVYCIADALDEMSLGNDIFIEQLVRLGQVKPATVKVFMTSRPVPRIERILKTKSVLQITLGQRLVDRDVAVYIEHRLAKVEAPKDVRKDIQQTLISKSQGLFLYTKLMMDDLLANSTVCISQPASLKDALEKLPNGLAAMYTRMLRDHSVLSGVPQSLQLTILQWVTHSARPLRLLEIAAMVDLLGKQPNSGASMEPFDRPRNTKNIIRTVCGPLLEILDDETVSIIHHSFTEYLTNNEVENDQLSFPSIVCATAHRDSPADKDQLSIPSIECATTHRDLAIMCLKYLVESGWADDFHYKAHEGPDSFWLVKLPPDIITAFARYPFLKYASSFWPHHAKQVSHADSQLFLTLDHFMNFNFKPFTSWLELRKAETGIADTSKLHVAAGEGLSHYVDHLIQLGQDIDCLDSNERTPVHRAAANGHTRVIEILLKHGANPDPSDKDNGLKPLHLAASSNHPSVVKVLLANGVDPKTPKTKETPGNWCGNAPRSFGNTAIMYAFEYGRAEAALAFVPYLKPEDLSQACKALFGVSLPLLLPILGL